MKLQLLEIIETDYTVLGIFGARKGAGEIYFVDLASIEDEEYKEYYPDIGTTLEIDEWFLCAPRKDLEQALKNIRPEGKRKQAAKKPLMKLKPGQKQCPNCGEIWGVRKQNCDCGHNFARGKPSKKIIGIKEVLIDFYGETLEEDGMADKMATAIYKKIEGK